MERRKGDKAQSSPLPHDYLKMVAEVFTTNFDAGLKALAKHAKGALSFEASGAIYPDEVLLCVSLLEEEQLAATSVYGSADFDPKASAPTAQDLLAACVDGIGAVFGQLLNPEDPKQLEALASESLSALESVPFEWTETPVDRYRVHLRIDKANPRLDQMADEWLKKNDPDLKRLQEEDQEAMEKLFITGPTRQRPGSGTKH